MEPILLPDLEIVDAHHHLVDTDHHRYLHDELFRDLACGHRFVASVYVENRSMYRRSGEEAFRSVGETEFAAGIAAMSASGNYGDAFACLGIVAHADLTLGHALDAVADAHEAAAGGRLKGFRQLTFADDDDRIGSYVSVRPTPGLMDDPAFEQGAAVLARRGLCFDAGVFHPQLPLLCALASDVPDLRIVLNHMGIPLGVGGYASSRADVFDAWRVSMAELAKRENVFVKLAGCGGALWGFDYASAQQPIDSATLADMWRPYMETTIELFGAQRCMFASNFPVDSRATDYHTLWNAMKRIAEPYTPQEQAALFRDTAVRAYRLPLDDQRER